MITYLVGLSIAILLIQSVVLLRQKKQLKQSDERIESLVQSIEEMSRDHSHLIHADLLFSRQLHEINTQLISMDNQMQGLENVRENDGGYQHALRILEMGGSREEIIESCHLSSAEAELLMNLQAYRSAMQTTVST